MFADVLDPLPVFSPYYQENARDAMRRRLRRLRKAALTLLPGLLLGGSLYCGVRYVQRLEESVVLATRLLAARAAAGEEVGFVPPASLRPKIPDRSAAPAQQFPAESLDPSPGLSSSAGRFVLNNAAIDLIPFFGELTVLYIGAFASALVALVLMALKEYGKEMLGLSEAELVLRRSGD
jgi:hypothetical protein